MKRKLGGEKGLASPFSHCPGYSQVRGRSIVQLSMEFREFWLLFIDTFSLVQWDLQRDCVSKSVLASIYCSLLRIISCMIQDRHDFLNLLSLEIPGVLATFFPISYIDITDPSDLPWS